MSWFAQIKCHDEMESLETDIYLISIHYKNSESNDKETKD